MAEWLRLVARQWHNNRSHHGVEALGTLLKPSVDYLRLPKAPTCSTYAQGQRRALGREPYERDAEQDQRGDRAFAQLPT
jgi:hypothetical protein